MGFQVNYLRGADDPGGPVADRDVWLTDDGDVVNEITVGGGRRIAKAGTVIAPQWRSVIESASTPKRKKGAGNKSRKGAADKEL